MTGVALMGGKRDRSGEKPHEETPQDAGKGEPVSAKLFKVHAKKLAELAREEGLESSAEAFDKHFGKLLDNLLIAAKARSLKRLQDEAGA